MEKILIKDCQYLYLNDQDGLEIRAGDILIADSKIQKLAPAIDAPGSKIIDGKEGLVMPGLVNTHTHASMTLLRSYADDLDLQTWLEEMIWPAEANLEAEHAYWGAMLAFLEMIKSGTTTFADMYFFMEDVAEAALKCGIRGVLSRGLIHFSDPEGKNLQENIDLIDKYHKKDEGLLTVLLGPHAPYTTTPEYLEKVMEAADAKGVGLHIHISETKKEVDDFMEQEGKSPVKYLEDLGLFDRHVVAAHCVHVSEEDIQILKKYNVGVCHNPSSNLKLGSGIAPIPRMLELGLNLGIGTDGASSNNNLNMFEEMHLTSLIHKGFNMDPLLLPAEEVLKMATIGGARVLGLDQEIGSIEEGKKADLIMIDLHKPHLYPQADLIANLVYSAQGSDVKHLMVNGRLLLENYQFLMYDEEEIMLKAEKMKEELL